LLKRFNINIEDQLCLSQGEQGCPLALELTAQLSGKLTAGSLTDNGDWVSP
jgi:hypothetical protein